MKHCKHFGFEYATIGDISYIKFRGKFIYRRICNIFNIIGFNFKAPC